MGKDSYIRFLGDKAINAALGFIAAAMLFFLAQYLWWQIFPYRTADVVVPMEIATDGLPPIFENEDGAKIRALQDDNFNEEVKRGGQLKIFLQFTKHTDVTPTVSRNIVCSDSSGSLSVYLVEGLPGGSARPVGTFTAKPIYQLPEQIEVGRECVFQFTNEYQVNPVRTITKVWQSEKFTVVE